MRPAHDFAEFDGVFCMVLQNQGDLSPKSEAGERVVPVHRRLLDLGLRDLVAQRIAERSYRLLGPQDRDRGRREDRASVVPAQYPHAAD